jgi:H+/Cl- antiporter ClcA
MKKMGDFTAEARLLWISALAVVIGSLCAVVARLLLWLISFFTNLFYHQTFSVNPENTPVGGVMALGLLSILIPVAGGLIIGLMARYGSERIRGHGIPEALEAILIGQSRMQPKVAVLKPLSSAISIGSGGPFGAEGPIIMTGGACGSIIAQVFHLTAAERKTLLVAGAAGGMAATFATPLAAVLLAVELLLFEWKPRSLIPVALACAAAMVVRPYLPGMEAGPLFPMRPPHAALNWAVLVTALPVGVAAGLFALLLTVSVYTMEDLFHRLPIHWMWWPAIGGLVVGVGGYFQPRALGVGYDIIRELMRGEMTLAVLVPLIIVKAVIWCTSLGSGTSGGVLAPLLIMGGALGAIEASLLGHILPPESPFGDSRLWPMLSMAAIMGGTMRSPFTGIVFALELTQDVTALPPLLIASFTAYAVTVLLMKRSILTEKVARRGHHITREYSIDPLERSTIGDVMSTDVVVIPASMPVKVLLSEYFFGAGLKRHQAYPVVDANGSLLGVVSRTNLLEEWVSLGLVSSSADDPGGRDIIIAFDLIHRPAIVAYPWESCRAAAERMAQEGVGRLPVVSPDDPRKVLGIITRSDLLKPRARDVEEEARRERFINLHLPHKGRDGAK